MNQSTIGVFLCCGGTLVPLVAGVALGRLLERRIKIYGMPGALLPGFIRKIMEDEKWK